jgi:hypothetical protein
VYDYQGGKVVFGQASYSWCAKAGLSGPNTLWTDQVMYCNLLLTTQVHRLRDEKDSTSLTNHTAHA